MIRVLGVDDHPLMMSGIAGAINAQPDMMLVGAANDGAGALPLFRELRPDVALMDLRMPDVCGIDAIVKIRAEFPDARIIALTTSAGDIQVLRAFKAGACGYLLKSRVRTELIGTIRHVHAGKCVIPADIAAELAAHAAHAGKNNTNIKEFEIQQEACVPTVRGHLTAAISALKRAIQNR